jgi:hypothetical protein
MLVQRQEPVEVAMIAGLWVWETGGWGMSNGVEVGLNEA